MRHLFFTIPLIISLIIIVISSHTVACDTEVKIVVRSGNITMEIIGENITRLIINGYDLKSLVSEVNKLDFYQRYIVNILSKQASRLNTLSLMLNTTIIRINNNTYLIMRNRRDIVLLALVLNKTMSRVSEINSTLSSLLLALECLQDNVTEQMIMLSGVNATAVRNSDMINTLNQRIDQLNSRVQQLETMCNDYKARLNEAYEKIGRLQQGILLTLITLLISCTAILIKIRRQGNMK